jgi:regulatory protein
MTTRDLSDAQHAMACSASDKSADPDADPESPIGEADPENVARAIALRMLERQPRTRAELGQGMARRGVPADVAAAVLDRFTEVGLIDDAAFAAAWVDSRHAGRSLGRRALSAELRRRGVDEETVRAAVEAVSPDDEEAAARALVARRLRTTGSAPRDAQIRRLTGMLARRGFGPGLAARVVHEALDAARG